MPIKFKIGSLQQLLQRLVSVFTTNNNITNQPYTYIPEECDWNHFFKQLFSYEYVDNHGNNVREWSILSHIGEAKTGNLPFDSYAATITKSSMSFIVKMIAEKYNMPFRGINRNGTYYNYRELIVVDHALHN